MKRRCVCAAQRRKIRTIASPATSARPKKLTSQKYQCLVLWRKRSRGAAEEGKAQKHLFGHSPRPLFGFQLVRAVKCKGKKAHRGADDEKIKYRLHIFILHPNAPFVKGEGQIFTKLWGKGGDFSTKKPRFIICACGMIKKRACYFGKGGNVCKRCFWTAARAASF